MHRKIFDEHRMSVGDRIEVGAGQRRVAVEFRLIAPRGQPASVGGHFGDGVFQSLEDGLLGLHPLVRDAVGGGAVESSDIDAFPEHAGDLRMHVRFDEARNDHRILESPVDLDSLVRHPAAHLVQRARAENPAVHHRDRLRRRRAGIEGDDHLRRVDRDLLRGAVRGRRGRGGDQRIDATRLPHELVVGGGQGGGYQNRGHKTCGKEKPRCRPHATLPKDVLSVRTFSIAWVKPR